MHYYLGLDLGTSSVKSLLMDGDGGIIGVSQRGYDMIKESLQRAEQDMEELWKAAAQTVAELVKRFPAEMGRLEGISFSGQMHGLVMTDKDGRLIRNAVIWADQRSGKEIEKVYGIVGKDAYRDITLNSLSTGFLLASLMWIKDHEPENYERIRYVMFPKDYIRYRICGEIGTDMTDASAGGAFDTRKRQWAWEIIDRLGLARSMFPPCHESCELAGKVSEVCTGETGLKKGIRVAYGGGDTFMMGVGNGIVSPGILASNIGTACQLSGGFCGPVYDAQFRTNTFCHVKKDLWLLMGAHLSGGVALRWLKDNIVRMDSFDEMTALAGTAPAGSEGLVFLPYLSGERTPYNDADAKGIYFGMTLKHTRAHLIRSTMEGIIFGLRSSGEILKSLGVTCHRMIASGGGARGKLFLQMQADNFDCEIFTNKADEQACTGAAATAAVACGEYKNYGEACERLVKLNAQRVEPDRENQKYYDRQYAVFRELYGRNKELFTFGMKKEEMQ